MDIESILGALKIPSYAKLRGKNLFSRMDEGATYLKGQIEQELWLYNRRLLTGPTKHVLGMDDTNNLIYGSNFASIDYLGLGDNKAAQ